jgi:hypothetical protein
MHKPWVQYPAQRKEGRKRKKEEEAKEEYHYMCVQSNSASSTTTSPTEVWYVTIKNCYQGLEIAPVVECLPSKCEAPSSNPSTQKNEFLPTREHITVR